VRSTPREVEDGGMRPLAEAPVPKDRWIGPEGEVVSYPPVPNELALGCANLFFAGDIQGFSWWAHASILDFPRG
jgi:hypothetical protein